MAAGAAVGEAGDGLLQVDAGDVGDADQPGEGVAQLVLELDGVARAQRLGDLADLLDPPPEGAVDPPGAVARPERRLNPRLQVAKLHGDHLGQAVYDAGMAELRVAAERHIGAPAEHVYRMVADYRAHHPRFLPPAFSDFQVEQGGVGAGTVHSFRLTAGGRTRAYRMRVDEPEPGRVLTESDQLSSAVTTFTVTPEGSGCRVRIGTSWQGAGGVGGFFERLFAPRVLRGIYADELARLDRYARE